MSVLEELEIEAVVSLGSWRWCDCVSFLASLLVHTGAGSDEDEQEIPKVRTKRKVSTISRSARGKTASIRTSKRRENRSLRWIQSSRKSEINSKTSVTRLSDLTLQMKAERESRLASSRAAPPIPEQKAVGNGITVMRFGAAKSPATERPVKAKTEIPAVKQTSYLPVAPWLVLFFLPASMLRSEENPFPFSLALKEAFASPNSYQRPAQGLFCTGQGRRKRQLGESGYSDR